jgi:hypothetical protein
MKGVKQMHGISRFWLPVWGAVALLLGLGSGRPAGATVVFSSGNHVINTPIIDDVEVDSGASLTLVAGGLISGSVTLHSAPLTVAGGSILGGVSVPYGGCVTVSNGSIGGDVMASGAPTCFSISGGTIGGNVSIAMGPVDVSGGSIGGDLFHYRGPTNVSDGVIGGVLYIGGYGAPSSITGGTIWSVSVHGVAPFSLSGGHIQAGLSSFGSTITVIGYNLMLTPIAGGPGRYQLTGTLQDGTPLDIPVVLYEGGQIVLNELCTAPNLSKVSAAPSVLWPPNNKLVLVTVSISATSNCQLQWTGIVQVTNNETGSADWQPGPQPNQVWLRASRSGGGIGRVYTITVAARNVAGQTTMQTVTVTVPHDQGHG